MSDLLDAAWLGRASYRAVWALQEALRERVLDGSGPETLLLVEHDPVITLGRSARRENVVAAPSLLAASGTEVVETTRGGDVTWHGPGQLVAYPVVRLQGSVPAHIEAMAGAVVEIAASLGVAAEYRPDCPGVWVGNDKLCAFGVQIHRRVAIHGLALNVNPPLDAFSAIVPCGLSCSGVTSIEALTRGGAPAPPLPQLAESLANALGRHFSRSVRFLGERSIDSLLSRSSSVE